MMTCKRRAHLTVPIINPNPQNYGRIVNIASIAGKEGNAGMLAYSASKGAVIALTKVSGLHARPTLVTATRLPSAPGRNVVGASSSPCTTTANNILLRFREHAPCAVHRKGVC